MATNGGAKTFKGSIGCVITNKEHKVLISCYGRTAGQNPLSFRTEASSFLAAIWVVITNPVEPLNALAPLSIAISIFFVSFNSLYERN